MTNMTMSTPRHGWRTRAALLATVLFAAILLLAPAAHAQTAEGTVIKNVATVTYTDANSNTYTPVKDSVSITVGFTAGITFTGAATATPASPSTADTLTFTYTNIGNGNDSLRVTESISVANIITVTGYRVNGTTYGSLAALNTALSGISVAQGGTLVVKVVYDVASGQGGLSTGYSLDGFSRRNAAATQSATTTVTPGMTAGVVVTPDGGQNLTHLPSNATTYTFTFGVQNTGTGPDDINLVVSHPGSAIAIVSVNGVAGTSTTISLAANASQNVDVVYTIGAVTAGTRDTLVLTGTSAFNGSVSDAGRADITVIMPSLAISKVAYRDDQTTLIGAGLVVPGEYIQYRITITNNGAASAASVEINDVLPAQLTFTSASPDAAGWTIGNVGNNVTASLSGALVSSGSRYIWIRARIN